MAALRALVYFFEEALTSLWRSRLINALSVGTIAVSLFVLGAFLTVASNLNQVVTRWVLTGRPKRLEETYPALRALLLHGVGGSGAPRAGARRDDGPTLAPRAGAERQDAR